jgi:hypothetical protein
MGAMLVPTPRHIRASTNAGLARARVASLKNRHGAELGARQRLRPHSSDRDFPPRRATGAQSCGCQMLVVASQQIPQEDGGGPRYGSVRSVS